jgi:sulfane dehydrogenase subunit SoxC
MGQKMLPSRNLRSEGRQRDQTLDEVEAYPVAENGLLHRRSFLKKGLIFAGTSSALSSGIEAARAAPLTEPPWALQSGDPMPAYQQPSKYAAKVIRTNANPDNLPKVTQTRTPHHLMEGQVTPNGLHFSICHAGVPEVDPDVHRLVIHGLVKRPLIFSAADLCRYPMVSRLAFIECGGNSAPLFSPEPVQGTAQDLHGLVSCAEWTGVKLSTLLEETGVEPSATWFVAEGGDAPHIDRSVPLAKAFDDALIALYQNGEPLMPGNGFPMRLVLPGFEGNMQTKFIRRIELTSEPAMSYYESQVYTVPLPSGKAYQFYFVCDVKSFITFPSYGFKLPRTGLYEISGLAYSGTGRISKVMVSADGGKTWGKAALQDPVMSKAFTRFRMPWRWDGGPAIIQSRAYDELGNAQPTRSQFVAARGQYEKVPDIKAFQNHHFNAVMSWGLDSNGDVKHVYA